MKWSRETAGKFVRKVLHAEGNPREIGLAMGVGVFIAFFPIFGTHTILVFALAWLFRVSTALVLVGAFLNNPFTMLPMYLLGLWLGLFVMGVGDVHIAWHMDLDTMYALAKVYIIPFCVGNLILGVGGGVIAHFLTVFGVKHYRRKHAIEKKLEEEQIKEEARLNL